MHQMLLPKLSRQDSAITFAIPSPDLQHWTLKAVEIWSTYNLIEVPRMFHVTQHMKLNNSREHTTTMSQSQENTSPTIESFLRLLLIAADEKQKLQSEIEKLKTDLTGAHKYNDLLFDDKEKLQQEIEKLKDEIEKLQTENERLLAGRPRDEKRKRSSSPVVKEEGNKAVRLDEDVYL